MYQIYQFKHQHPNDPVSRSFKCTVLREIRSWICAVYFGLRGQTHGFIMCNYESDLIPFLPDLSCHCPWAHSTFTTSKRFTSPKHTVDTFEGWVNSWWWSEREQPDRFIYMEVERRGRARSCICLKAGPNTQTENKEEWSSLCYRVWALSAFSTARPRQIYQSSFNVIYSYGVERN